MCLIACRRLLSSVRVCICARRVASSETGTAGAVAPFSNELADTVCTLGAGSGGGGIISAAVAFDGSIAAVADAEAVLFIVEVVKKLNTPGPAVAKPGSGA